MKRKPTEIRKAEIIEASMKIIASKGAKRFTAQLIADEVGMTAGGIFRHFATMDDIVEGILDRMEEVLFDGFPPSAEDPWTRLKEFFEHRVLVMVAHPDISKILLSDHLAHLAGEIAAARVKGLKRRSQQFVTQCLQEAADRGELATDVSVNAAKVVVLGAILAVGHATPRIANQTETKQLKGEVWCAIEKMHHISGTDNHRKKGGHRQ